MCTEESSTPTSAHQKTNEHVNENICNLEAKKFRIIQFLNGVGQDTWSNVSFRIIRFEHEEFDTSCRCFWSSSISVVPMSTVLFWFLEALLYVSGDAWKKKVECNYGSELQSLDYSNYSNTEWGSSTNCTWYSSSSSWKFENPWIGISFHCHQLWLKLTVVPLHYFCSSLYEVEEREGGHTSP